MVFSEALISKRLNKLRERTLIKGSDAVFIPVIEGYNWQTCYYFSGFRGSSGAVVVTRNNAFFITDARYIAQAAFEVPFEVVDRKGNSLIDASIELMKKHSIKRLGIQEDKMPVSVYFSLSKEFEMFDVSKDVSFIRREKTKEEVALIKKACDLAACALESVIASIKDIRTEREFDALLEYTLAKSSADGGWQDHKFIVASGDRSALPHGRASDRAFAMGEWVTVDFGARYRGYVSDITRNVLLGDIPEEWKERHEILLEAQRAAAKVLKPGIRCEEVDAAARRAIEKAGYGNFFTHGTGHGIGLDLHEAPIISPSSKDVLIVGDVVTIEPGIYIEGVGGMRVEDDYVITPQGAECISNAVSKVFMVSM